MNKYFEAVRLKIGTCLIIGCLALPVGAATITQVKNNGFESSDVVFCLSKSGLQHYVNPREAMEVYKALVYEYMIPQLGFQIQFRFFENDKKMYRKISENQADIGCGHLVNFLKHYKKSLVKPLVRFQQKKRAGRLSNDHYILIVRKKDNIQHVGQLRGKTLGINHPHDTNKIRYLFFSKLAGYDEKTYFKSVKMYNSSRNSIFSLFYRTTDVVLETEYALDVFTKLRPELGEAIQPFLKHPDSIADLPIFYRASADKEKMARIQKCGEFFARMHEDPGLHQMLYFLGCDRAMPISPEDEKRYQQWTEKYSAMELF
ncbi:phosphate/phosphite/phosphonate ABC transporter substrate-binding protein [bacterium]|nr:phosphate/phosphite/phosphonate ABC transporter substrate-binding protein [bacterium]